MQDKKIYLENEENLLAISFGLAKLSEDDKFYQVALALSQEGLLFYNDNMPDEANESGLLYRVKIRIPFTSLLIVFNEKIKKNKELKKYLRLKIVTTIENKIHYFYYLKKDKSSIKQLLKLLKKRRVKVKKRKVDLSPNI